LRREVTRCLRADIRRAKTRALELPVSPRVAKASLQDLHAYIRIEGRVVASEPVWQK
jgi:hypothetical protein